jgi:hypothetical protein
MNDVRPTLTEPGVKYFLTQTLRQCHKVRIKYNDLIVNACLFTSFMLVLGIILLYKYKGKLTPREKDTKDKEKQQYILSKIKQVQETNKQISQSLITGLPSWNSEFDAIHVK